MPPTCSAPRPSPSTVAGAPQGGAVRGQILAAGLDMVQRQGLRGLTQARVAQAAGLRQSHLTYYFPTRKDLLKALAQAIHDGMVEELRGLVPESKATEVTLDSVRELLALRIRDPLMARLMAALSNAADEDGSLRQWLRDFNDVALQLWRELFARAGLALSTDDLALLHATVVGAATLNAQTGTPEAAELAARVVRQAFDRTAQAAGPLVLHTAQEGEPRPGGARVSQEHNP